MNSRPTGHASKKAANHKRVETTVELRSEELRAMTSAERKRALRDFEREFARGVENERRAFWRGVRRGWALAHVIACPPGAALLFWIGKPFPASILVVGFVAAVLVWRQERRQ